MQLKNIPDPGFSDDDGTADPELAAALAAWAESRSAVTRAGEPSADGGDGGDGHPSAEAGDGSAGHPSAEARVLAALATARLLVPVVAVLGESEEDAHGLRREKSSDMAVPTLRAGDRRALPAFTSVAALARWDPAARPVAVPLHQALRAAAHEQADTVVIDLAGPVPYQLTGGALRAAAEGRTSADPLHDPAVTAAVRSAAEAEPAVRRAYLGPGTADGILALVLDPASPAAGAVRRVAGALAADDVLRARLVRGLDLAVLPAGATPPGEPLFVR